jgi:hypothetical protein
VEKFVDYFWKAPVKKPISALAKPRPFWYTGQPLINQLQAAPDDASAGATAASLPQPPIPKLSTIGYE